MDEYEFNDVASSHPEKVQELLQLLDKEMLEMIPPVNLLDQGVEDASPSHFNGTWMPWIKEEGP